MAANIPIRFFKEEIDENTMSPVMPLNEYFVDEAKNWLNRNLIVFSYIPHYKTKTAVKEKIDISLTAGKCIAIKWSG